MNNLYCHSKEHKIIILLLISFVSWESSAIDDTLRVLSIIEFATDLGNSLHEANLLIVLISDSNLFVEQIQDACEASFKSIKFDMSKIQNLWSQYTEWFVILSGDNSRSKKWSTLFWNNINCKRQVLIKFIKRVIYLTNIFNLYNQ